MTLFLFLLFFFWYFFYLDYAQFCPIPFLSHPSPSHSRTRTRLFAMKRLSFWLVISKTPLKFLFPQHSKGGVLPCHG